MSTSSTRKVIVAGTTCFVLLFAGCASFKLPGWPSAKPASQKGPGFASRVSDSAKGFNGQIKSVGSTISSAYQKTTTAVKNTFSSKESSELGDDPTSLANMPTNLGPEIWVTNGQVYESQGLYSKAMDNYTKALEQDPKSEIALLSIARLYVREGQFGEATEFFQKAAARNPSASTFNELAMAHQGSGNIPAAQNAIQRAIELDGSNPRYRNNLAGLLVSSGQSDEAVKLLQDIFPPSVANYNVAYLHLQNQDLAAAKQYLGTALQHDPKLTQAQQLWAQVGESPVAQSALAGYQAAETVYRTAEGAVNSGSVIANQAVYQLPQMPQLPSTSGAPATGLPTVPVGPVGR